MTTSCHPQGKESVFAFSLASRAEEGNLGVFPPLLPINLLVLFNSILCLLESGGDPVRAAEAAMERVMLGKLGADFFCCTSPGGLKNILRDHWSIVGISVRRLLLALSFLGLGMLLGNHRNKPIMGTLNLDWEQCLDGTYRRQGLVLRKFF